MNKQTDNTRKPAQDRDAMAKADKAREHSQIDESGARVDNTVTEKNSNKTSDRSTKPDPRKM